MIDQPFENEPTSAGDVLELANKIAHSELEHLHKALRMPSRFNNARQLTALDTQSSIDCNTDQTLTNST